MPQIFAWFASHLSHQKHRLRPSQRPRACSNGAHSCPAKPWALLIGMGLFSISMNPTRSGQCEGNHWTRVSIELFAMRWVCPSLSWGLERKQIGPASQSQPHWSAHHRTHRAWKRQALEGYKSQAIARQSRHASLAWRCNSTNISSHPISTGHFLLWCVFHPGWSRNLQLSFQHLARKKWNWCESSGQLPSPSSPHEALSVVGS